MSGSAKGKGQPLVALLAVLAGWAGGRAATWEAPPIFDDAPVFDDARAPGRQPSLSTTLAGYVVDGRTGPQSLPAAVAPAVDQSAYALSNDPVLLRSSPIPARPAIPGGLWAFGPMQDGRPWAPARSGRSRSAPILVPASVFSSRIDEFGNERAPRFLAPEMPRAPSGAVSGAVNGWQTTSPSNPGRGRRWSMDAWALLRRDGAGPSSAGALPTTYGASQSGAVLRYRLALSSRYRPSVYIRTTSALNGVQDNAIALGLSGRPLPSMPFVAAVEARLADQNGVRGVRPAAFVYTELPQIALPARLRAETYAQAGYVGGPFATLFADGSARVDRQLLRLGAAEARIGGGLWAGAQRGAGRIDVGPSILAAAPLGRGTLGRVSLDWRFRLAGNALPDSGPAVTLSAGF